MKCGSDSLKHDHKSLVSLGHVSFVGYSTVYTFLFLGLGDKDYVHRMLRWEF